MLYLYNTKSSSQRILFLSQLVEGSQDWRPFGKRREIGGN